VQQANFSNPFARVRVEHGWQHPQARRFWNTIRLDPLPIDRIAREFVDLRRIEIYFLLSAMKFACCLAGSRPGDARITAELRSFGARERRRRGRRNDARSE